MMNRCIDCKGLMPFLPGKISENIQINIVCSETESQASGNIGKRDLVQTKRIVFFFNFEPDKSDVHRAVLAWLVQSHQKS
jgi:hypothetical protein